MFSDRILDEKSVQLFQGFSSISVKMRDTWVQLGLFEVWDAVVGLLHTVRRALCRCTGHWALRLLLDALPVDSYVGVTLATHPV